MNGRRGQRPPQKGAHMQAYNIVYEFKGKKYTANIDARDIKSAKRKIGHKHGYKTGRMIKINEVHVVGYF